MASTEAMTYYQLSYTDSYGTQTLFINSGNEYLKDVLLSYNDIKYDHSYKQHHITLESTVKTKAYVDTVEDFINSNEDTESTIKVCNDVYTNEQVDSFVDEDNIKLVSRSQDASLSWFFIEPFTSSS